MCFKETGICPECGSPIGMKGIVDKLYVFSCSKCEWEGSDFKTKKIKSDFRNQAKIGHDCGIVEGELHKENCDMEQCSFCGQQLLTCGCRYTEVGYNIDNLPEDISNNGLDDVEREKWKEKLQEKGRIPYIFYPNICNKCGVLWPIYINIPPEDLMKYTFIDGKRHLFCRTCYNEVKSMIDTGQQDKNIFPDKCNYCGSMGSDLRNIKEENWIRFIEPMMRDKTFCLKCYDRMKSLLNQT